MFSKAIVSVIIPTYGMPLYLEKAILSVTNQSFQNWELIVVDDNNPDTPERKATEELLQKFDNDERIIYIKHPENLNGAVARNTGIKRASGKYVAFLDSDDEYYPERLQRCYDIMESQPMTTAGVYSGCEFRKQGKVYHIQSEVKSGNFLVQTLACTFMFCSGSNIFVRKSVVDEVEGFDEKFLRHQDYEFLVRIFKRYDIVGVSEVLIIKNNENFNLPNIQKLISIKEQYLEKYSSEIEALSQKDKDYIYHNNWLAIAENAQRIGDWKNAGKYYSKAKEAGRLSIKEYMRRIAFGILVLAKGKASNENK